MSSFQFNGTLDWNFGLAWIAFALAVALHVADEARHDFLATYNPNAIAIRRRLHIPFPPVFTLRTCLGRLGSGVCLLLLFRRSLCTARTGSVSWPCHWPFSSASPTDSDTSALRCITAAGWPAS